MPKRKISKASKRRLTFFGTISLVAIIYFGFSLIYNAYLIYDLTKEKNNLENLYVELQEEAESLKIDIEKLNDENYLANYAREHYLYSKGGEYKIQVDNIEEIQKDISYEMNKNYIILTLSLLMLLIFIYILSKGKRKKKRK